LFKPCLTGRDSPEKKLIQKNHVFLAIVLGVFLAATLHAGEDAAEEAAAKKERAKWSVSQADGYTETVVIDTRETTWSEITISPDGKSMVFDMLGDLYRVPLSGGEATALTDGIEWNYQPRFSPDGSAIAFISDRSGGDNLWIMDANGSNPHAVSDEPEHIIHTPNWSPDGQFLAARKSYTSTRSIAAGEIWMFHAAGGKGVALVKRPLGVKDQKNISEPAWSPDGRYVYYSQDMWPGERWEYNKDSTVGIFAIQRLELETGETEIIVKGPGGAIRPTPSPDGKKLAYVSRKPGLTSILMLKDLKSGEQSMLYEGLDRDLQETNGTMGNTPAIAWTPDGESIVFWSGGGFHRVAISSRQVTDIPVHIKAEKKIRPALRFPVDVAPDSFRVSMVRWPQLTPDRKKIVFQALGRIWVRDQASGKQKPLTRETDRLEYYPVLSADGKHVAFVSWDDQKLGSVRTISLSGRNEKVITKEPGHYIEPAWSPDGKRLTFRKISGGYLLSPMWSMRPGIYVADVNGGAPQRILTEGAEPHFGGGNDRIFYLDNSGDLETELDLHSINLKGKDKRSHLHAKKATTFRVSPDGKWVAFSYQYNTYVAPFFATGGPVDIKAKSKLFPVRQVSGRSGEFLSWNADSSGLTWSQGPVFYQRELADAFAFLAGAPKELPEPVTQGTDLGFEHAFDRPDGMIALVGGRVVTMRDADSTQEIIEDGVVLVKGNRIIAVGPRGNVEIPDGTRVVSAEGKTILPGLVDAHAHGGFATNEILPNQNWMQYSNLSFGVTTIHDPSNDSSEVFAAADLQKAGMAVTPRIYSTGRILYGAHRPGATVKINSLEDATFHVQRIKDSGGISVKSYNQPRRDQRQQVIAAAADLEMMVVPEGGAKYQHNMTMVIDGHTGIEHALPIMDVYEDTFQLWSQTGTGYTPTFGVAYGGLSGETFWYDRTNVWENERLAAFTPRAIVEPVSIRRSKAPDSHYNHIGVATTAYELRKRGVSVHIGAHGQREGLAAHWEMWMMVQGGFSPWEAWRGASIDGARYLGMDKDLGSLEAGKLADMVVVDGNDNIRDSGNVSMTMANGRLYDSATMNQLLPTARSRRPFFFELPGGDTWQPAAVDAYQRKAERHHWVH
jgi:Tol biopolymer transport system component/imidazolonepropionase-like amidohydrolase